MPYYPDINTLFIHIPKTGGTSLEEYLKKKSKQTLFSGRTNSILPNNFKSISLQHQYFVTIKKYKELLQVPFDETMQIITIVRNPYDRIISDLLWYKLIGKEDLTNKEKIYCIIKEYVFSDKYDNHNSSQTSFLLNEDGQIESSIRIFKTESLTRNLHEYGFDDYKGKEESNKYKDCLNRNSITLINNIYHNDFKNFDYEKMELSDCPCPTGDIKEELA